MLNLILAPTTNNNHKAGSVVIKNEHDSDMEPW